MRLAALAGLAVLLAGGGVAASGAGTAAGGFSYGVASGEITASSAIVWTRADRAGPLSVEVSRAPSLRPPLARTTATASPGRDLTVQKQLANLQPATRYYYRFRQGASASPVGSFRTAPLPTSTAPVRFAVSGDADATPGANGAPAFNRFEVYARMAAERNDFNINLGDTIYSDSEVAGAKPALTLPEKRVKYRQNLALPALRALRAQTGLYSHWDDHEFVNDFSRAESGAALYAAGVAAFTEYAPVSYSTDGGLYRAFRWGKSLELFFLDERSFRSAKASAGGACGTPLDVAPTAPAAIRKRFATIAPPLRDPAPPGCKERIDDPSRTMLGASQLARFLRDIRASTATFKVVVNEVPLQQFYALPYDRWEGYAAERRTVLDALRKVRNVVVLTTDTHANLVGDVRQQTFEAGGAVATGITEVVTGPVATNTFAREIDGILGVPGAGLLVGTLFLKPPPPVGIGMRCVAPNVYSYAEVAVAARRLTVTLKDAAGRPVTDVSGAPCAPVVIQAH
jgi:phosphodiesterase/alkaline phosphatase D-like protein